MFREIRVSFLWAYREDPRKLWQTLGAIALIFFAIVFFGWWAGVQ